MNNFLKNSSNKNLQSSDIVDQISLFTNNLCCCCSFCCCCCWVKAKRFSISASQMEMIKRIEQIITADIHPLPGNIYNKK